MDMHTSEITTAARRITRELNSRPLHFRVAFDVDGHILGAVFGQNVDASGLGKLEGVAHVLPSRPDSFGGRWSQRTVQDFLDEPEF